MAQTGILDYSRYLNTLQTLTEIGNTFPSSQNTYRFAVGGTTSTQGWTATLSWNTLIIDDYLIKSNGEPDFENSKVIGYFTTGTANQYSTGTISIPANMYLGAILPGTTYHTPITIVNVDWVKDGINYAVNLGFIQNWEPGVVLGDPYFDDGFEPVVSERSTLVLTGPGLRIYGDDITLEVTTDIPVDLPAGSRTVYYFVTLNGVRTLLGQSEFVDKSSSFTFNTITAGLTGGTYPIVAEYFGFREYGLSRSNVLQQVVAVAIPLLVSSETLSPDLEEYFPQQIINYDLTLIADPQYFPGPVPVANTATVNIARSPIGLVPTTDTAIVSANLVNGNISTPLSFVEGSIDINLTRNGTVFRVLTSTIVTNSYLSSIVKVENTASIRTDWQLYRPGPYAAGSHSKIVTLTTNTTRLTFGEAFPLTVTRTPSETYFSEELIITVDGRNNRLFFNTITLLSTSTISTTTTVLATFTATNVATNTYSVTVDSLGSGTHFISAVYPGDLGSSIFIANLASTSNVITHVVRPGNTLDAILTFQRTADADILRLIASTSTTMTNAVSFFQGATLLGTADWVATTTVITTVTSTTVGSPAFTTRFVPSGLPDAGISNSSNGYPFPYNTATISFQWPFNPNGYNMADGWIKWPGDRGVDYINRLTGVVLNSNSPAANIDYNKSRRPPEYETYWDYKFPILNSVGRGVPADIRNFPTFFQFPNKFTMFGQWAEQRPARQFFNNFDVTNTIPWFEKFGGLHSDRLKVGNWVSYIPGVSTESPNTWIVNQGRPGLQSPSSSYSSGTFIFGVSDPIPNLPRTFVFGGKTYTVSNYTGSYNPIKAAYIPWITERTPRNQSGPPLYRPYPTPIGPGLTNAEIDAMGLAANYPVSGDRPDMNTVPDYRNYDRTVGTPSYQYVISGLTSVQATPSPNGPNYFSDLILTEYDGSLVAHRNYVDNFMKLPATDLGDTTFLNTFFNSGTVTMLSTEVTTTATVITGYNPNNRVATLILPRGTITSLETTRATWPGTMALPRQFYKYLPIEVYAQLPPSALTITPVATYAVVSAYETQSLNTTYNLALENYTANTIYPTNPIQVSASVFVDPDYYSGLTQGTVTFFNTQTGATIGSTSTVNGTATLNVSIDDLTTSTSTVNLSIGATFDGDSSLNSTATNVLNVSVAASTGTVVPFAFAGGIIPNITNYSLGILTKADFSAGQTGDVKLVSSLNALLPFAPFRGIRSTINDQITYNRDRRSNYNFTFSYRIIGASALINPNFITGNLLCSLIYRSGSGSPFPQPSKTTNTVTYSKYYPLKYQVAQQNLDYAGMAFWRGKSDLDYTYTPWAPILAELLGDNAIPIVTSTGEHRFLRWTDTFTSIEINMTVDCAFLNATYQSGASLYYGTSSNPPGSKIIIDKHAFRLYGNN